MTPTSQEIAEALSFVKPLTKPVHAAYCETCGFSDEAWVLAAAYESLLAQNNELREELKREKAKIQELKGKSILQTTEDYRKLQKEAKEQIDYLLEKEHFLKQELEKSEASLKQAQLTYERSLAETRESVKELTAYFNKSLDIKIKEIKTERDSFREQLAEATNDRNYLAKQVTDLSIDIKRRANDLYEERVTHKEKRMLEIALAKARERIAELEAKIAGDKHGK